MASAGSIFVDLLLNDGKYVQGLNRSSQATNRAASSWQSNANKTRDSFYSVINPIDNISTSVARLSGVLGGALSVQKLVQYSDTWKQLEGRLDIVASSMGGIEGVQTQLFDIAQRTRQPLEGVYNLYTKLAQSVPEAARGQYDFLGVTESINAALAITGEGSAQASSAILQFAQAASSGFKASGQEINALLDSAPRLAIALQNLYGDGSKSLKKLAEDGELSLDVIFKGLSGTGKEGKKLREEFSRLSPTVMQSFTQLDNAFMQYIGQSDTAASTTGLFALGITGLANNLDTVVNTATILSTLLVARLIPSAIASAVSFGSMTTSSLALQLALARMEGISAVAATGLLGLGAAGRAASIGLAAVGGPIGLAAIAAITAFTLNTNTAVEAEERYNKILGEVGQSYVGYATASRQARESIEKDSQARANAIIQERNELEKLVFALASMPKTNGNALLVGLSDFAGKFGLGQSPSELLAQYEAAQEALDKIQKQRQNANAPYTTGAIDVDEKALKSAKKLQKELDSIYEKNETYITGQSKAFISYSDSLEEISRLYEAGRISADEYYSAVSSLDEEFDKSAKKASVWAFDIEEASKQAARNIQDEFANFLFDPFAEGLDGMLMGFLDVLKRMAAEALSAKILSGLFGDSGFDIGGIIGKIGGAFAGGSVATSGGASADGFLSDYYDGMFAEGGFIQPGHFGIAGEAGAELVFGGKSGATVIPQNAGGGVNVNIINNNGSQVSQSQRQTSSGIEIDVMIDQAVAANIGRQGSKTNQALSSYNSRALTRR